VEETGSGRLVAGYATATAEELQRFVTSRYLPDDEIDRATAVLQSSDPGGLNGTVTRDMVARVGVHLTGFVGRVPVRGPAWRMIVEGSMAAPAIFYHEGGADDGNSIQTGPGR
jgi:hypothetical protein